MNKPVILIGYSGHGFVAADILLQAGYNVVGYCDNEEKTINPFNLKFAGTEEAFFENSSNCTGYSAFIAIGKGALRKQIFRFLAEKGVEIVNAIHPRAVVSSTVQFGKGVFVAAGAIINPAVTIGDGVICNTNCSIDHDCNIGDFSHICPGSVLCGNVTVGPDSFIGAGSTIIPGVKVDSKIIVGAGSTVLEDLSTSGTYVGTPATLLLH